MTITEQLESIASEICDKYCKYPVLAEDPEKWEEQVANGECEACNNCPLVNLL